ncbi:MAG TPA: metal-dependent hydrolase [Bryobacteraceae bacterium]|nr:metal-dependent hydrolase [Bryobacteraceae bacterium]
MDNLTHTLTGVLLARAGLGKLSPRATWIAALAANIPDIDVVSLAGGPTAYLLYHRWATHAIVFVPLMAILPVLIVAALFRAKLPWFKAWLVSLVAVASHLLLDFTNPYGIRLWLPFSDDWPSLDITNVVDLWIWVILLVGCFWPLLSGLVGSEIGSKAKPGQGTAIAALIAIALYDGARFISHRSATDTLQTRVYEGAAPRKTFLFPHFANPMRWDGWVETERSWQLVRVDMAQEEFDPEPLRMAWKAEEQPAMAVARQLPVFQVMQKFARTPLWRVTPSAGVPDADLVELIDLRFGRGEQNGFRATAVVDKTGRVIESGFQF